MCRESKNSKPKIWDQTETKLWFVPNTPLNEDLSGPTHYHLVLQPHLILIPLGTESQLRDHFYLNVKEQILVTIENSGYGLIIVNGVFQWLSNHLFPFWFSSDIFLAA